MTDYISTETKFQILRLKLERDEAGPDNEIESQDRKQTGNSPESVETNKPDEFCIAPDLVRVSTFEKWNKQERREEETRIKWELNEIHSSM